MERIGVFVCHCGTNIAATVDVKAVAEALSHEPGVVVAADSKQGLIVCAESGFIRLKEIQAEGGKRMADTAYLLGHKIEIGTKLNG